MLCVCVCICMCAHTGVNACPVLGVQAGVLLCYVTDVCPYMVGSVCCVYLYVCTHVCIRCGNTCSTSSPVCCFSLLGNK